MRDVYYQSVGNPLQTDRLPVTRPVTQFLSRANVLDTGMFIVQVPGISLIIGAVTMLIYQAPGFALFDPYDLWLRVTTRSDRCQVSKNSTANQWLRIVETVGARRQCRRKSMSQSRLPRISWSVRPAVLLRTILSWLEVFDCQICKCTNLLYHSGDFLFVMITPATAIKSA